MLADYEKKSLLTVLERITPDRLSDFIELLIELYNQRPECADYQTASAILQKTLKSLKSAEKTTSINRV